MNKHLIGVIGDIHGCFHTLTKLYSKIKNKVNEVYCVGDLIDRGLYSKQVVQFCFDQNIKSVKGNHEYMLLNAIEYKKSWFKFGDSYLDLFFSNGGRNTQRSYIEVPSRKDFPKFKNEVISIGHYDYIKSFPLKYELEKVIISHAGIIENGDDKTILWNREKPAYLNKLQIFGHTPIKEIIYHQHYFANIDTGCAYDNKLTCIIVDRIKGEIIETLEEKTIYSDIVK